MKLAIVLIIFIFVFVQNMRTQTNVPEPTVQINNKVDEKNKYIQSKLKFYFEYSDSAKIDEWIEGVTLWNTPKQPVKMQISVFNYSKKNDKYTFFKASKEYNWLKKAKISETIEDNDFGIGIHTKIETLKVAGYTAYKVLNEYNPKESRSAIPDVGQGVGPVYAVSVFLKKGEDIWVVSNYAHSKPQQEKNAKTFEEVLKTLKFLN